MDHRRHELENVDVHQGDENQRTDSGIPAGGSQDAPPKPLTDYSDVGIHQVVCNGLQQAIEYVTIGRYESALVRIQHDRGQFPLIVNLRKGDDGQFQADSGDVDISGGGSPYTMYIVDASALPVAEAAERYLLETLLQLQATQVDVLVQLRHGMRTDNFRGRSGVAEGQLHKDSPVAGV